MQATITGVDPLSKRILLDLNKGKKVSEIPDHYPVSIDQAKRLSRFNNMLGLAKENLEEEYYNRLQLLGIKCLPLSPLFRQFDWGGLKEILSVVTDETKRFLFVKKKKKKKKKKKIKIVFKKKKKKKIYEFKENADFTFSQLEDAE